MAFVGRDAGFSDEQHQLADVAAELFAAVNPPSRVRGLWEVDEPRDRSVWSRLAELGLTGIGAGERHGGTDGGPADLVLVLEQAGGHLLPEPLDSTVAVAVPTLAAAGGEPAERWLPRIAAGTATVAVALAGSPFVRDLDDADVVLVERDHELWLVTGSRSGHPRVRSEDGSLRQFRRAALDGAGSVSLASAAVRLGGADLVVAARTHAVLANAAQLVGVMDRLVADAVAYARMRRQFGTAIGSFQAVQHRLVDMFVAVESARGVVRRAARVLHDGADDGAHAVTIAAAAAAEAHEHVNRDALQVFAGIGFTWEHDLHLWLKRGLALEAELGGARDHRRGIADRLFGSG